MKLLPKPRGCLVVPVALLLLILAPLVRTAATRTTAQEKNNNNEPWWKVLRRRFRSKNKLLKRFLVKDNKEEEDGEPVPRSIPDFLTPQEAETLLARYEPLLRDSLHFHKDDDKGGGGSAVQSEYRTSRSIRLPPLGDELVFAIERRAAQLAGFNHSQVEDFQLACYGPDQLYGLHRDDAPGTGQATANRAATVLIYLRQPEAGGATLFTRRPLEDEIDPATGQALRTQAAAIQLFRDYCQHPQPNFVVFEPQVGTAATWLNWYGDGFETFAKSSTHGACPVVRGQKCVIQQWITKSKKLPLRDERLAALFLAGADYSFRSNVEDGQRGRCLNDVSSQQGYYLPNLCIDEGDWIDFVELNDSQGPKPGVGALHVRGGLHSTLALPRESAGLTISFWAKDLSAGTTLISLDDQLSVALVSRDSYKWKFELRNNNDTEGSTHSGIDKASSSLEIYNFDPETEWFWFSLALYWADSLAEFSVFSSSGDLLGNARANHVKDVCKSNDESQHTEFRMFFHPKVGHASASKIERRATFVAQNRSDEELVAFVQNPSEDPDPASDGEVHSADVSFIVLHNAVLGREEVVSLRREAGRYNIRT